MRRIGPRAWCLRRGCVTIAARSTGEGRTVVITAHSICRGLYADSVPTVGSAREVYKIFASLTPRAFANFPSDFWFDAIGSCPAGLTMQSAATWSVGSGATGIVNWGGPGGRSSGTNISNGNNTSYTAWGRCLSTYSGTFGPENKQSYYYGSVPSAPSVWVSRFSNQVGQRFTVNISSSACSSNGMRTDFYLDGYRGRTWGTSASFTDYWNSPGGRTYTGYIRCVDAASNAGNASASRSASVSIYVPAPSAPTWVSVSGGSRSSIPGGGIGLNYVTYSAGGSSWASSYRTQQNVAVVSQGWIGWSSDHSCTKRAKTLWGRADASGPGGTSAGWSYSGQQGIGAVRNVNNGGCF